MTKDRVVDKVEDWVVAPCRHTLHGISSVGTGFRCTETLGQESFFLLFCLGLSERVAVNNLKLYLVIYVFYDVLLCSYVVVWADGLIGEFLRFYWDDVLC